MTATQFREALERLGLSQIGAARLFGADARTARRWALGEVGVPPTVAILLRLMLRGKVTAAEIAAAQS
jgi:transcriptional regulator with XRE-family HTH domain